MILTNDECSRLFDFGFLTRVSENCGQQQSDKIDRLVLEGRKRGQNFVFLPAITKHQHCDAL